MHCSHAHLARLMDGTPESIETSSQHLDLISDLERVNLSHLRDLVELARRGGRGRCRAVTRCCASRLESACRRLYVLCSQGCCEVKPL